MVNSQRTILLFALKRVRDIADFKADGQGTDFPEHRVEQKKVIKEV